MASKSVFQKLKSLARETPVLLLAGGSGTRAREVTKDEIPKQMILLNEKESIIEFLCKKIIANGFNNVHILLGHHGEMLQDHICNSNMIESSVLSRMQFYLNRNIQSPAEAVYKSLKHFNLASDVLVLVTDSLLPWSKLFGVIERHKIANSTLTLGVTSVTTLRMVDIGGKILSRTDGRVLNILDSTDQRIPSDSEIIATASTGVFVVNAEKYITSLHKAMVYYGIQHMSELSFNKHIQRYLMSNNQLFGYDMERPILDMGTPDNIAYGIQHFKEFE